MMCVSRRWAARREAGAGPADLESDDDDDEDPERICVLRWPVSY
jgi:hypothetical protein